MKLKKIPVAGQVVWMTPNEAQDNRLTGIGIQFTEQDSVAVNKIETYLAGMLDAERATHTM